MEAIKNFFGNLFSKVPDIIIAIIILVVAFYVAKFAKKLVVKLLKSVKAEAFLSKLGIKDTVTNSSIEFVGKLVYFVVFLLFLPGALDKLDLSKVTTEAGTEYTGIVIKPNKTILPRNLLILYLYYNGASDVWNYEF